MQKEKIKLFNRELYLTERKAFDVYELEEYVKKNSTNTLGIIYGDVLFIESALKFNYDRLCFKISILGKQLVLPFRPIRYLIYKKILSAEFLLKNLTRSEMLDLIKKVWFLETGEDLDKKKVKTILKEAEKESAENILQH